MKTILYALFLMLLLAGCSAKNDSISSSNNSNATKQYKQATTNQTRQLSSIRNTSIPSKEKAEKMSKEIFTEFMYSGKYIKNNLTANLYTASFLWAVNWAFDKKRLDSATHNKFAKYRMKQLSKCYSLVEAYSNNLSLMSSNPKVNELLYEWSKGMVIDLRKNKYMGIAKYNVTPEQLHRIVSWQYAYGQPAICGCEREPEVIQFCRKYNYKPVLPLGNTSY